MDNDLHPKTKKILKKNLIINIIHLIGLVLYVLLFISIIKLNLLPDKYLVMSGLGLLIIEIVLFILINIKNKFIKILGMIIIIIGIILSSVGIYYIKTTNKFLDQSFSKKVTTTTAYYLITKSGNKYKEEDITGDVYYYNNFELKDVKKYLTKFNINYVESDSMVQLLKDVKSGSKKFMLIDKTNYNLAFDLDNELSSKDYEIVYKFDTKKVAQKEDKNTKNKFTLLIVGNDFAGYNDLNLLVTVNLDKNKALVTTIPRGYYIPVEGKGGRKDTLSFMAPYGIDTSVKSIANYFKINIDYYLKINTHSLVGLVDEIGGITYCSDKAYYTTHSLVLDTYEDTKGKFYVKKGCQQLNGIQTLTVARERKAFYDGDRTRQKNCVKIMQAILEKMKNTNTLTNYNNILTSLSDLYETDIPKEEVSLIIKKILENSVSITIETQSVDGDETKDYVHLTDFLDYVIVPREDTVLNATANINTLLND